MQGLMTVEHARGLADVMSSFGGSFLGSMLGSRMSQPAVVAGGGGGAPVIVESSSSGSWALLLFLLALLGGVGYVVYRVLRTDPEPKLTFSPVAIFREIQGAFARGDRAVLSRLLGPDMVEMIASAPEPDPNAVATASGVSYLIESMDNSLVTVRYAFTDAGRVLCERWHFTPGTSGWVLNGIEQVA